ncbi:MAG: D-alanine--D-alanine ligase [Pseudomonadota bacterium]
MSLAQVSIPKQKIESEPLQSRGSDFSVPDLVSGTPPLSYFEFWPASLFYLPMKIYGFYLSLRYGGLTLPTITNPLFDVGGFHGESKAQIHTQISKELYDQFADTLDLEKKANEDANDTLERGLSLLKEKEWQYPLIVKPDIGMRGMGVQKLHKDDDLLAYIKEFPESAKMIFQNLYDYPHEVGLFYIREPHEEKGHIFSLTMKYFSHVIGDGTSTLKELIENHPRYGQISHVYLPRHEKNWDLIIKEGQPYKIAFAGSHSRGTIFKDGNHLITHKMEDAWDTLSKKIPEFYFGRFDVRFHDLSDLETLENMKIVEINGAGAEATHIWDSKTKLLDAYKTLMKQYKLMYKIGAANKKRGFKPMKLKPLLDRMKVAEGLADQYPHTH